MAVTLIFDNGLVGGELDFNQATRAVTSYPMATPTREGQESVTESITVFFDSGLQSARSGTGILRSLGQYFQDARSRQKTQSGERIFIMFAAYTADDVWRSEILDGRILWPPETLGGAYLPSDKGEVTIAITRRAFWEKDSEYELPLSIGGAYATGGRAIENHHDSDAGDRNWVAWEDWSILGDLPAPLRIEFTSTHATLNVRRVMMALTHKVHDTGDYSLNWSLEGEANLYNPGTVTANANSSGGNYMVEQWAVTTETKVFQWAVNNMDYARGAPFRAVARFVSNASDDIYARLVILGGGTTTTEIWRSKLAKVAWRSGAAEELTDLGTIPALPPGTPDGVSYSTVYIDLYFLRNVAGTHTVNLDYLDLMPMDAGFRVVDSTANSIAIGQDQVLVDDGINERTYERNALGVVTTGWRSKTDYLKVQPGHAGRLTFHWQDNQATPTARADLTASVRLYYRPRRMTL
jgi:hypothetical protein